MDKNKFDMECDLLVIGAGITGMSASLFAAKKGLSVVQAGLVSELGMASGLLDLMAVYPTKEAKIWDNPWDAIDVLKKEKENHPYARIDSNDINYALLEFVLFLKDEGLGYICKENLNSQVITPVGTVKYSYYIPDAMWDGVKAFSEKTPCLIVDINNLKGFNAHQIKEILSPKWKDLRSVRITFPESKGEVYTNHIARALEKDSICDKFAETIHPHIKDAKVIGIPAVLGVLNSNHVISNLKKKLGVHVFEIPTMPPSVPGLRIREAFGKGLLKLGVKSIYQQKISKVVSCSNDEFIIDVGVDSNKKTIKSKGVILASGRFFGKGLTADRKDIKETVFNLPVIQPENRALWHNKDFFNLKGHAINQAGINIDNNFNPLDSSCKPLYKNLFAAGSILANNDWMRMKCGSGVAISTAFASVQSFIRNLK